MRSGLLRSLSGGTAVLLAAALLFVFLFPALPTLAAGDAYNADHPEDLSEDHIKAQAAILIEADSGAVIFEKNADQTMYPASTTKILTALLAILMGDMESSVTTTASALAVPEDSSVIPLAEGEVINFSDLVYATMVKSGNDGANLIAETISGDTETFVALMNSAAAAFGCTNTHFVNAHGYHDENHYTTARDMAIIAREAMKNETFRKVALTTNFTLPKDNVYRSRTVTSQSDVLMNAARGSDYYYQYANGIKTGSHSAAGYCYVGSATKEGVTLISVVFNTTNEGRWTDTRKLMEYGYTQYISVTPQELYALNPRTVDISAFALDDSDLGRLQLSVSKVDGAANDNIVTLKSRVDYLSTNFSALVSIEYTRSLEAPVTAGEVMGTMTYYPESGEPVVYNLLATRSIARREKLAPSVDDIIAYTDADPNPFPRFSFELALLCLTPALAVALLIFLIARIIRRIKGKRKPRVKSVRPISRYYR